MRVGKGWGAGLFGKAGNEQVNTAKVGSVVLRQEGEVGGV